jgi:hypothetical protein
MFVQDIILHPAFCTFYCSIIHALLTPRSVGQPPSPVRSSSSARVTIYLSPLTSKSDTRRSVPASSPHKFLFGTKRGPPKNGEKEMNDGGEPDLYNKDGYEVVADSSSYDSRKLQPSSFFSFTPLQTKQHLQLHLRNVTTDHHHQIRLPCRNLTRPHSLSFVALI